MATQFELSHIVIPTAVARAGTTVGATANMIVVSELGESGIPDARVSPMQWLRIGLPMMLVSLSVASVLFVLLFDFLR